LRLAGPVSPSSWLSSGEKDKEWELQHDLALKAFRTGLLGKITMMRGDIDSIIRKGRDSLRKRLGFSILMSSHSINKWRPFLPRSRGLTWGGSKQFQCSLSGKVSRKWLYLLISCNLDQVEQGEIRNTLANMKTELVRYGCDGDRIIDAYLNHSREESRLKLYVPFFVNKEAAKESLQLRHKEGDFFYEGNKKVPDDGFSVLLVLRSEDRISSRTARKIEPDNQSALHRDKRRRKVRDDSWAAQTRLTESRRKQRCELSLSKKFGTHVDRSFRMSTLPGNPKHKDCSSHKPTGYDTQYWAEWSQPYGFAPYHCTVKENTTIRNSGCTTSWSRTMNEDVPNQQNFFGRQLWGTE